MQSTMIKDFKEGHEIVGYYRNFGQDVSITVNDVKQYVPKDQWHICIYSASREIKKLNELCNI